MNPETTDKRIVYAEATFSMSIMYPNHYGKYFKQLVYCSVYCVLTLIAALQFYRTECSLDNQL